MDTFFIATVLALLATLIEGVKNTFDQVFETASEDHAVKAWSYRTIVEGAVRGATLKAALRAAKTTNRRRRTGDKTRAGNAQSLLRKQQHNAARKAASAAVAAKYGHKLAQKIAETKKSLHGVSFDVVVTSIAHLGGKKKKAHGSGKTAAQYRKNTYARKSVGGMAAISCRMPAKVQAKSIVREESVQQVRTIVTKEQRFAARGIIIWQRRAAKTANFHAWVAAQDGGWISQKGAAKAAALSVNTKAAAAAFTKVTGHTVTEAAAVKVAA